MMTLNYNINEVNSEDKKRWNELLYNSLYPSYRQSIEYEKSKENNNRKVTSFIFNYNGEDIAGVNYAIKKSKYNLITTADIQSGFIFKNQPTKDLLLLLINHFEEFAKINNASFIRVNPWLPQSIRGESTNIKTLFYSAMKNYDILTEGRHTYWIDLRKSEDYLLKKMKRQTRYDVRQGLKSNIKTIVYQDPDNKLIQKFWEYYKIIATEKNFHMYPEEKFKHEVHSLMEAGYANLFVYTYQDTIVNFSIASNFGIASYLHGAINYNFKELEGCPSPGQLAQWSMIKTMKGKNAMIYDMGFCPGPIPQKDHPSYKIWRFKYGFGGDHVQFLPIYGKVLKPIRGRLFKYLKYRN